MRRELLREKESENGFLGHSCISEMWGEKGRKNIFKRRTLTVRIHLLCVLFNRTQRSFTRDISLPYNIKEDDYKGI